ncbi:MAG: hypothetical protein ACAI35_10910 [Candidatus Methylacidiphilales bacterium]|nr:hypothetical protein [Candidatus Methylacidiphilales bacterium]
MNNQNLKEILIACDEDARARARLHQPREWRELRGRLFAQGAEAEEKHEAASWMSLNWLTIGAIAVAACATSIGLVFQAPSSGSNVVINNSQQIRVVNPNGNGSESANQSPAEQNNTPAPQPSAP